MKGGEATAWANKRKAAMEKAALLREQRKNGGANNEEQPSFAPQINKRPSYLKQQDSLDKLTVDIKHDPNDVFEQPLPGARGIQTFQNEMNLPKLPSPGSDALGKEIKRYPSGPNDENRMQQPAYKSKFLQQYSNEVSQQEAEHFQSNGHRQTTSQNHITPTKHEYEEADNSFMSSLRGNPGSGKKTVSSAGPGWNDDVTTSGFAPAPVVKSKTGLARTTRPRVQEQSQTQKEYNYDNNGEHVQSQQYQTPAPVRQGRRAGQQQSSRGEWNADTEVIHRDASELPVKLTPRASPRGIPVATQRSRPDAAGAAASAAPNLSLLKSKIRRSGSNNTLNYTNSATTFSSTASDICGGSNNSGYNNDYIGSNTGAAEHVAEIKRSGRRSAPNPSFPSGDSGNNGIARGGRSGRSAASAFHNESNEYAEQQMGYQDRYEPSSMTQRPRARDPPPQQQQRQQYQQPPPVASRPSFQQQQSQQSQRRGYEEADVQDDPYGADAYPSSSAAGMASEPEEYGGGDAGEQRECPDCGRKFNPIPYAKHVKICSKVFMQKRKVFDSSKMRMDAEMEKLAKAAEKEEKKLAAKNKKKGTAVPIKEQAKFAPSAIVGGGSNEMTAAANKAAKWKADSEAFRAAMKAARDYAKAKADGAPLPPPVASAPNPHLVPCPHCGRSFSEQAGLRHIPQCQNIKAKPTMLRRGAGGGGGVNGAPTAGASSKGKQKGFMG